MRDNWQIVLALSIVLYSFIVSSTDARLYGVLALFMVPVLYFLLLPKYRDVEAEDADVKRLLSELEGFAQGGVIR